MVEEQIKALTESYPGTSANRLPSGAWQVIIPDFQLGAGWNQEKAAISFIIPVGYPYAKPDCFWADKTLRLASSAMPQASNITAMPETNFTGLWFSWHLKEQWNPNVDTLLNWIAVIANRLRAAQ